MQYYLTNNKQGNEMDSITTDALSQMIAKLQTAIWTWEAKSEPTESEVNSLNLRLMNLRAFCNQSHVGE